MLFVIDNYDSFTYNLVQYLGELGAELLVRRNDEVTVAEIEAARPDKILISPGPGTPTEAGVTLAAIEHFAGRVPIFGVCLGHQAIGQFFGGRVVRAPTPVHGKPAEIAHDLSRVAASVQSRALSFAHRRARFHARLSRSLGDDARWTRDGPAPSHAANRGRPVSS
jgi:anthranilate synthase/aminodeoxychorismate synthase-like glutamine amidotransferase